MPVATSILFVEMFTADAALTLLVEPPHSEPAAKSWVRQSSFTSLTEYTCGHTAECMSETDYDGNKFNILQTHNSWYLVLESRTLKGHPAHTEPFQRPNGWQGTDSSCGKRQLSTSWGRPLSYSLEVAQVRRTRGVSMLVPTHRRSAFHWKRYGVAVALAVWVSTPLNKSEWFNLYVLIRSNLDIELLWLCILYCHTPAWKWHACNKTIDFLRNPFFLFLHYQQSEYYNSIG
jgi:hypothetical protein